MLRADVWLIDWLSHTSTRPRVGACGMLATMVPNYHLFLGYFRHDLIFCSSVFLAANVRAVILLFVKHSFSIYSRLQIKMFDFYVSFKFFESHNSFKLLFVKTLKLLFKWYICFLSKTMLNNYYTVFVNVILFSLFF